MLGIKPVRGLGISFWTAGFSGSAAHIDVGRVDCVHRLHKLFWLVTRAFHVCSCAGFLISLKHGRGKIMTLS
jgi:hypothetical protein